MKRYIFAAAVALFTLTSCVFSDGTEADPNKANSLLYNRVKSVVTHDVASIVEYAVYADVLMSGSEEEKSNIAKFFGPINYEVTEYYVVFSYSNYSYVVTTQGKSLSEGGIWSLNVVYNSPALSDDTLPIVEIMGVQGAERTFKVLKSWEYEETISVDFLCEYNTITDSHVDLKIGGSGKIEKEGHYTLNYTINEIDPLLLVNFFTLKGGEVTIKYEDLITGKKRSTTATIGHNGNVNYTE